MEEEQKSSNYFQIDSNEDALEYFNEIFPNLNNGNLIEQRQSIRNTTANLFERQPINNATNKNTPFERKINKIGTQNETAKNIENNANNRNTQLLQDETKNNQLIKVMKEYEYRINKHVDLQLSSLGHEKKLKKLLNLKASLLKKFSKRRNEMSNMLVYQDDIKSKELNQKDEIGNALIANKKSKVTGFIGKHKSIFKKISNKQKYKIETRYKKIREIYIKSKKVKKQDKKRLKKPANFLFYQNFGKIDYPKLITHIEQNDWRIFIEKKAHCILDPK